MPQRIVLVTAAFSTMMSLTALAQSFDVSALEVRKPERPLSAPQITSPNYITDVTGKKVRLVGPRFYPDNARALDFPGRKADPVVASGEGVLSQR